jgi:hypothetical protein
MRALATAAVAIFAAACAPKPRVMLTCDDFKKNSDGTCGARFANWSPL